MYWAHLKTISLNSEASHVNRNVTFNSRIATCAPAREKNWEYLFVQTASTFSSIFPDFIIINILMYVHYLTQRCTNQSIHTLRYIHSTLFARKTLNLKQAYSEWVHYQKTGGSLSGPKAVMKHTVIQCSEVRLQSGCTDVLM